MSKRNAVAALFGAVLFATPAAAFNVIGWDWSHQNAPMSAPFFVNHTSFPSSAGAPADVRTALRGALERWELEGESQFSFNYGGATTSTSFTHGDHHIAQFKGAAISGSTLAVAQSWGFGDTMTDCDIEFYASNGFGPITWSSDPAGASFSTMDLEQIATHEFGHCAGLDHSATRDAMMFSTASSGGGPSDRTLHADDIAGLQFMYGAAVGADLEMSVFGSFTAGSTVDIVVTGADSGDKVWLAFSPAGAGDGPCFPALGGSCAGLLAPITPVASTFASGAGQGVITLTIPPGVAGMDVALQAVVLNSSGPALMSNVFEGVP